MVWWLSPRAYQTVLYRIILQKKSIFYTISCKMPFKIIIILFSFYYFKKTSLLTVWYTLRPSQQATVSLNYSQSIRIIIGPWDGGTIIPSSHHIMLKIDRFYDTNSSGSDIFVERFPPVCLILNLDLTDYIPSSLIVPRYVNTYVYNLPACTMQHVS